MEAHHLFELHLLPAQIVALVLHLQHIAFPRVASAVFGHLANLLVYVSTVVLCLLVLHSWSLAYWWLVYPYQQLLNSSPQSSCSCHLLGMDATCSTASVSTASLAIVADNSASRSRVSICLLISSLSLIKPFSFFPMHAFVLMQQL